MEVTTLDWKVMVIMILFVVVIVGFVSDIHNVECSQPTLIPDWSTFSGDCPHICECNSSLDICKVPVCEHINCKLQWYGICLGTELK